MFAIYDDEPERDGGLAEPPDGIDIFYSPSHGLKTSDQVFIVEGQGELHLTVVLGKLKQKFGVDVNTIEPRIPYRETIIGRAEGHHRHKKQSGGRGQFGEVYLRIEPKGRGDGYEFDDAVVGGNIPRNFCRF